MNTLRKTTLAVAACGLLVTSAFQASAAPVTKVTADSLATLQEIPVSYADLDLSSAEGQEVLYYRISSAAREVCGPVDLRLAGSVRVANRNQACFEESLSRAMSDLPRHEVAASN
jgi:UrcA family protein